MFLKVFKILGLVNLIIFSIVSLISVQFQRELESSRINPYVKKVLSYPLTIEKSIFDYRNNLALKRHKSHKNSTTNKIVLGAIDELSIKHYGRFPWPRSVWAKLIRQLEKLGVKEIAFDVIFSEEELNSEGDGLFIQAISDFQQQGGAVIIPYSLAQADSQHQEIIFNETPVDLYNYIIETQEPEDISLKPHKVMSSTFPIEKLLDVHPALGYIGSNPDHDGIFRKYPLVVKLENVYVPSFSLIAYEKFKKTTSKLKVLTSGTGILSFDKGGIELNNLGETEIRWLGSDNFFETFSLRSLDKGSIPPKLAAILKDSMVFIGSTSFAAHDLRHTPIDSELPGVFYHMNMTQMLLDNYLYQGKDKSLLVSWILFCIGVLVFLLIAKFKNSVYNSVFAIAFTIGLIIYDYYYLLPHGYQISLFIILHAVIGSYLWISILDFYAATRDRNFLKHAFGTYISPELIEIMHKEGHEPHLGGVSQEITAFFSDIQGFTTISEGLTPAELVEVLNEYLTCMTNLLLESRGTLDKYEGDAMVAFFGAPVRFEDHAYRACFAATQMQKALLKLKQQWRAQYKWNDLVCNMHMRIGLNTGVAVVGNMGSESRMNYTMMGDEVNLASRLEQAGKQYGVYNLVSESTYKATYNDFVYREVDTIRVVGKSIPVKTYELLGQKGEVHREILDGIERFHKALSLYKNMVFEEAMVIFEELISWEKSRYPESDNTTSPSEIYLDRCIQFLQSPPDKDWDGVYTLTEK